MDGEVDAHTADRLSRRLHSAVSLATEKGLLSVDLTRAIFVGAAGVTVLRNARMSASLPQVAVTMVGLPPHIESTL